jgi:hypothetical protein
VPPGMEGRCCEDGGPVGEQLLTMGERRPLPACGGGGPPNLRWHRRPEGEKELRPCGGIVRCFDGLLPTFARRI